MKPQYRVFIFLRNKCLWSVSFFISSSMWTKRCIHQLSFDINLDLKTDHLGERLLPKISSAFTQPYHQKSSADIKDFSYPLLILLFSHHVRYSMESGQGHVARYRTIKVGVDSAMENPVKNIIEIKFRGKVSGEIFKYITIIISGVKSASGKNSSV